ncbi:MAG: hypothetical protein R3F59_06780 [Myxococcota bacterium]
MAALCARGLAQRDADGFRLLRAARRAAVADPAPHRAWAVARVEALLPRSAAPTPARPTPRCRRCVPTCWPRGRARIRRPRLRSWTAWPRSSGSTARSPSSRRCWPRRLPRAAGDDAATARLLWLRAGTDPNRDPARALADVAEVLRLEPDPRRRGRALLLQVQLERFRGPAAVAQRLDALDAAGLPREVALRLEAARCVLADALGEVDAHTSGVRLEAVAAELQALGELYDAVYVGIEAVSRLARVDRARALGVAEHQVALAADLVDPRMVGQAHLTLAGALAAAGRGDEAEAAFARAAERFARAEPIRRVQVASQRARLRLDRGDHAGARADLELYLGWARRAGSVASTCDALLVLCSLEIDAERPARGAVHAAEAAALAAAAGHPHLLAHAELDLAVAEAIAGRAAEAALALDRVVRDHLTPVGAHQAQVCAHAVARALGLAPPPAEATDVDAIAAVDRRNLSRLVALEPR